MGARRRWIKFWPQDWQRDPALRSCGIAARGLWMDMICIAHDGDPYGHVTINGKAATPRQIASITGITEKEARGLITELEDAGVFSRTDANVIFSRRMVRDHEASEAGREAIEKRWTGDDKSKKVNPQNAISPPTRDAIRKPIGDPITPPNRPPDSLEAEAESEAERVPSQQIQTQSPREPPAAINGHKSHPNRMPNLNSPWSAWEWLTDGEVEITGPNAERRPCAGGYYVDYVAERIALAAGFNGYLHAVDWRPMVGWLRAGATCEEIESAIGRVASREDYTAKTNLNYFTRAVLENRKAPV